MKRNKILIGSVGLVAVAAFFAISSLVFNGTEGSYVQKDLPSLESKSSEDAMKWLQARYIDQETGLPISPEKLELIRTQIRKSPRSKAISFTEKGPNNIGGRTRAIQINRNDVNQVWAGGVSGGLFVSTNRGDIWTRVDSYMNAGASPFISSMTQTSDGTLYVATGSNAEGWNGNGVWYSTDEGGTWQKIPGTTNCNEIVSSHVNGDNNAWLATSTGLKKWKVGDAALNNAPTIGTLPTQALQISKDGMVIVAGVQANKTYVSTDGGSTFTDKSGPITSGLVPSGASRIEYAISHARVGGKYSIYAVRTGSNLVGMNVSHDDGATWDQFVGASGTPSNLDIYRNQGTYNSIVSVTPNNNERILIGGIDIWQWNQTVDNPPSGGFEKLTEWFLSPFSPQYAHADNHEMKWDQTNRLYIGNDGGIGITDDYGQNWYPANRGYNVTQFYGIAFDSEGAVMGGAQDNGTLYNYYSFSDSMQFAEVNGGDGFECEISFFNPKVMFSSVYYNSISRSGDRGQTWSSFVPDLPGTYDPAGTEGNYHPFHTEFVLAEYYDPNSQDSVIYIPTKNYAINSTLRIPSMSTGDSMNYITPTALHFDDTLYYDPSLTILDVSVINAINSQEVLLGNYTWTPFASASGTDPPTVGDTILVDFPTGADTVVVASLGSYDHYYGQNLATGEQYSLGSDTVAYNIAWDTLMIKDPYQSWFLVYVNANGGELWGTRNALRLASADPNWVCIAKNIGGGLYNNVDIEFSRDLAYCYVSAGAGVWRIDGLGSVYTSDANFNTKAGFGSSINAGAFVIGKEYMIGTSGSTNFTLIGSSSNAVGTIFTATGPGTGTGAAFPTPTVSDFTKITTTSYEGIALNPNDANDLVVFTGFSGTNKRTGNATAATPMFTTLGTITSPSVACYDGIIDRDDSDVIVVGTSEGVFVTEDGGAVWENASAGFEGTPVYEVRQSWRTWDEGARRPGEIYIGTYGRGIWASASYLGIGENDAAGNQIFKTKLKTYPNPTTDNTTLTFNLSETSNVTVHVYNITGTKVKSITHKNVSPGAQTLTIDGSDLANGTYIIKFVAGKQNETVKFIKM